MTTPSTPSLDAPTVDGEAESCSIAGCSREGFSQGLGKWLGTAEVFGGDGRFVGNAVDQRHVRTAVDDTHVRIELSFIGPLKFSGHYTIEDRKDHRLYQGPANFGFAEVLGPNAIDANGYWPATGLTQRLFLYVLPGGDKQVSLSLMTRGEELIYAIVGENARVLDGAPSTGTPGLIDGTAYDLRDDVTGGHGEVLAHRAGRWVGELTCLDAALAPLGSTRYEETIEVVPRAADARLAGLPGGALRVRTVGGRASPEPAQFTLLENGRQAWTPPGDVVGSHSLSGGRALVGTFHHVRSGLRVWRREVITHDGALKVVVHTWYRGGARCAVEHGVLEWRA